MPHPVHHVPGRLRLRGPRLEGNAERFDRLRVTLSAAPGVHSVEMRPRTGSVVVHYDPERADPEALVSLAADQAQPLGDASVRRDPSQALGEALGRKAVGHLAKRLLPAPLEVGLLLFG